MNSEEIEKVLDTYGEPLVMNVKGLEFNFPKPLYKKIRTMCHRITHENKDACLINEGYEGDGKTTSSLLEAIVAYSFIEEKIKDVTIHLFFKTSSCIEFAKRTKNKIIILDEPGLESLSNDSQTTLSKDFFRLVTMMRNKHHFFIINFTKFWKFPDFLVVDRALGMVRMDTRNGKYPRRFLYIRQKNLENLWNDKKKHNKRNYNRWKSFIARMPSIKLSTIFNKFNIQVEKKLKATEEVYDAEKDNAVESIGKVKLTKEASKYKEQNDKLKRGILVMIDKLKLNKSEIAPLLGVNRHTLRDWSNLVRATEPI